MISPNCVCSERPPCQSNRMNRVKLGFREDTLFVKLTFSGNLSFSTQQAQVQVNLPGKCQNDNLQ